MKSHPAPKVGDILYSVNVGNATRYREQVATPVKVIAVGRKYFTCCEPGAVNSRYAHTQYHLDNWREKTEYSCNSALYLSEQEWRDEKKSQELFRTIGGHFHIGRTDLTLDQLTRIDAILREGQPAAQ